MHDTTRVPPEDRQFGDMVVAQGLCSRPKVDECLSFLGRLIAEGVTPIPRLGELLARRGYLSADRVDATFKATPASAGRETRGDQELPKDIAQAASDPANLLGKYVKVSPLGAGGMGEVWRGWDRELRRWVALKFLHHSDAAQQARFLREAQTAAALSHPNIASVYEVGEKDGKPFIAMQFVAGQTLATVPRNDLRRLIDLVRDAALAVHAAHEQGVVHRDLKPANLMVEKDHVFVMDFGLAKPTTVDSSLSASGQILGTPAYMAPEQARGDSARVGPRSDVYALGATLYDLLADRPPHHETEVYALLKKIIDDDPAPLRKRNPRVPRDLETIVTKCLEKDPDRRYATARELADDLTRWLKGQTILAHPPTIRYRIQKFTLRHKAVVAMGATGVLVASVLLAIWFRERSEKRDITRLAELRTQMLVIKEWSHQGFRTPREIKARVEQEMKRVEAFVSAHPRLPQGYYVRAQGWFMLRDPDRGEEDLRRCIELAPGFSPAWVRLARLLLSRYEDNLGSTDEKERLAKRQAARHYLLEAIDALKKGWQEGNEQLAVERWGLARTLEDTVAERVARALREHFLENNSSAAIKTLQDAHAEAPDEVYCLWLANLCSGAAERDGWLDLAIKIAPLSPDGYQERGDRRLQRRDFAGALADYDTLVSLWPEEADGYLGRAQVWMLRNDFEKALAECSRAVTVDPKCGAAWITRAAIQQRRGNFEESVRDATKGIALLPKQPLGFSNRSAGRLGKQDWKGAVEDASAAIDIAPSLAIAWANRAGARIFLGDFERALADATRAIELDPSMAIAYANRSGAHLERGEANEALKDADKAVELDSSLAIAYSNRGMALTLNDHLDAALADFNRAIELDPKLAIAYAGRGAAQMRREDWDAGIRDCDRAIELDPTLFQAFSNRGGARTAKGDHEGALADANKAIELNPRRHEPYIMRGLALHSLKQTPRAVADIETALKLAPAEWPHRKDVEKMLEDIRAGKDP